MRLDVNAVRLTRPFTGVGRYLESVLAEWQRSAPRFEEIALWSPRPLNGADLCFSPGHFRQIVGGPPGPDPWWENRFLRGPKADRSVLFSPSYTLPKGEPGPSAVLYHGPAFDPRLGYARLRNWLYNRLHRRSAREATLVFVTSESVRTHVVDHFQVDPARIRVAYGAPNPRFRPPTAAERLVETGKRWAVGDRPFVLFVGKLVPRHYITELLAAFADATAETPEWDLVLAGPNRANIPLAGLIDQNRLGGRVRHYPFVGLQDLPSLYAAATVFLYPTDSTEGFGLPVVESMACGTPVLSVAQGSIPEVAGEAAELVATPDRAALGASLRLLIEDPARRTLLAERGLVRAASFSWQRTAEVLAKGLYEIAHR